LRELFGEDVIIDVFEEKHVGGRLAPVTISGFNYNAGGTIIHPANQYMVNFTNLLGMVLFAIVIQLSQFYFLPMQYAIYIHIQCLKKKPF